MNIRPWCKSMFLGTLVLFGISFSGMAKTDQSSFLPTWKLLNFEQKRVFISGYVQGWSDAAAVNEIALGYAKENPAKAIEALDQVGQIYKVHSPPAIDLVKALDVYYAQAENREASLSMALTAARSALVPKGN